jgi:acyl-CoA reductase-like NAD-dependent aldehyde dehydrogenase
MKSVSLKLRVSAAFGVLLALAYLTAATTAQRRDHLTPAEVELIRTAQALDKRTEIFVKAAERRLLALTDARAAQAEQAKREKEQAKGLEDWGALPAGTRADLLSDMAGIFDEAITNIDDVAARDEHSAMLAKSLRRLGAAAERFLTQLQPLRAAAADGAEQQALERTLQELQEITDAAKRLPPETDTKKPKQ